MAKANSSCRAIAIFGSVMVWALAVSGASGVSNAFAQTSDVQPASSSNAVLESTESSLHTDLALPYLLHLPEQGAANAPLIVLLHGMGSNEEDLFSLTPTFPAQYAVASLRAPYTLGPDSFQWYQSETPGGQLDGDTQQLASSSAAILKMIGQLVKQYDFDPRHVYLVGFSQGAIMSYEVALTNPGVIRGIGVMSGTIYDSLVPQIKPSFTLSTLQVFISQGSADPRIPPDYAIASNARLRTLGIRANFHLYPGMEHEISRQALHDLDRWLAVQTP